MKYKTQECDLKSVNFSTDALLIFSGQLFSQESGCKVLLPSISGTYTGKCKNGLAHGKGIAQGTDRYEGRFYKGYPQGPGTYTWKDGSYYKGQWSEGLMQGKGMMVYKTADGDSVVNGYWQEGKYVGAKLIPGL